MSSTTLKAAPRTVVLASLAVLAGCAVVQVPAMSTDQQAREAAQVDADAHTAFADLDGTGVYEGQRSFWGFSLGALEHNPSRQRLLSALTPGRDRSKHRVAVAEAHHLEAGVSRSMTPLLSDDVLLSARARAAAQVEDDAHFGLDDELVEEPPPPVRCYLAQERDGGRGELQTDCTLDMAEPGGLRRRPSLPPL